MKGCPAACPLCRPIPQRRPGAVCRAGLWVAAGALPPPQPSPCLRRHRRRRRCCRRCRARVATPRLQQRLRRHRRRRPTAPLSGGPAVAAWAGASAAAAGVSGPAATAAHGGGGGSEGGGAVVVVTVDLSTQAEEEKEDCPESPGPSPSCIARAFKVGKRADLKCVPARGWGERCKRVTQMRAAGEWARAACFAAEFLIYPYRQTYCLSSLCAGFMIRDRREGRRTKRKLEGGRPIHSDLTPADGRVRQPLLRHLPPRGQANSESKGPGQRRLAC